MDLKRNAVRRIARNSINYPDELGIVACIPSAVSGNECPVGEIFKPIIPIEKEKQRKAIREAVEELRDEGRSLDYEARFVNENKCSLGPEIHSILQEMKSLSPREIAELVPRISPKIEKLADKDREAFVGDIEKIIQEDQRRTRSVTLFNLAYLAILTVMLVVVIYAKKDSYDILVSPKSLPGFSNYWGFAIVNVLLGFSLFYFYYRYSFRITDLKTFQFASFAHIAALVSFYIFLRNSERNYARLAFIMSSVGILFQSSIVLNYEDVPGLNKLLINHPSLYEKCLTVQTTQLDKKASETNWVDVLVSLLTNLIPNVYLAIQYYKIA
jgi:hypothetical protein